MRQSSTRTPSASPFGFCHYLLAHVRLFPTVLILALQPYRADGTTFVCFEGSRENVVPCVVSLVPEDPTSAIQSTRSGTEKTFKTRRYRLRAQARGLALARHTGLTVAEEGDAANSTLVALPLVPGGALRVDYGELAGTTAIEVLSISTGRTDVLFRGREASIPFPAGIVIALGLSAPEVFTGVTEPWNVEVGHETVVPRFHVSLPDRSVLVIRADYPQGASVTNTSAVRMFLERGDLKFLSQAAVNSPEGTHYEVFYDLPYGRYGLKVDSRLWTLPSTTIDVASPVLLREGLTFSRTPTIAFHLDGLQATEAWSVAAYSCAAEVFQEGWTSWPKLEDCHEQAKGAGIGGEQVLLEGLPPNKYFLRVTDGRRFAGKRVDLTSGKSVEERLAFDSPRVFGVVRRGSSPIPARLSFVNDDSMIAELDTVSDQQGRYEGSVWTNSAYRVTVQPLDDEEGPPATFVITVHDPEHRFDPVVPASRLRIIVTDADKDSPIEGAVVATAAGGISQAWTTDHDGTSRVAAPVDGVFRAGIEAKGYKPERVTRQIADSDAVQDLRVALTPLRDDLAFTATLAGGQPAANAIVFPGTGGFVRCGSDATCTLAIRPPDDAVMFVLHSAAAITPVRAATALVSRTVLLQPPSPEIVIGVTRGVETRESLLEAEVAVDGILIPQDVLNTFASLSRKVAASFIFPGQSNPFAFFGLPTGERRLAIYDVTLSAGGRAKPRKLLEEIQVVGDQSLSLP